VTYNSGTYTVAASGTDIWGTSDQFRFVYRQVSGDVTIVAKVSSIRNVDEWSKAGVMIRESLSAGSKHGFALVSVARGVAFQRRRGTSGSSVNTSGGSGAPPAWVKLERRGSTLTASRSSDGSNWTVIGTDTITMSATVYVGLAATSHDPAAATTATIASVSVQTGASSSLPSGWSASDVGSPAVPGATSYSSGTFTLDGAGADIWGTADQFRFAYRQVSGDIDIVARVVSVENVDAWSKAGVMIRSSLAANAAHASMFVSAGNGFAYQRRPSTGSSSVSTAKAAGASPMWVKLQRRGSTVTAFRSSTGSSWTTVGTQTLTLPSTFYIGMGVTSHDVSSATTAKFDGVAVTAPSTSNQLPSVSLTSPASGATFAALVTITVSATASDPDGTVARVDFYQGSTLIGSDTSSPYSITWPSVAAGTYSVVAIARDNAGGTTTSSARTVIVGSSTLPDLAVFVPSSNNSVVSSYRLEIYTAGANVATATPIATRNLGKPPIVNGECQVDITTTISALPSGTYVATVTAVGSSGSTESAASPPFTR
jgi:regulation of enolase protein 1 (concanavalin A-like superfamily)